MRSGEVVIPCPAFMGFIGFMGFVGFMGLSPCFRHQEDKIGDIGLRVATNVET